MLPLFSSSRKQNRPLPGRFQASKVQPHVLTTWWDKAVSQSSHLAGINWSKNVIFIITKEIDRKLTNQNLVTPILWQLRAERWYLELHTCLRSQHGRDGEYELSSWLMMRSQKTATSDLWSENITHWCQFSNPHTISEKFFTESCEREALFAELLVYWRCVKIKKFAQSRVCTQTNGVKDWTGRWNF
jgi:hypothetical protein